MKFEFSRRRMLGVLTGTLAGLVSAPAARAAKAVVQKKLGASINLGEIRL